MYRYRSILRRLARMMPGNMCRCKLYEWGLVKLGTEVGIARGVFLGNEVSIGRNTLIGSGAVIEDKVLVGNNVTIGQNAHIGPKVIIGDNVTIGRQSTLYNCIIGDHSIVEYGVVFAGNGKNWITIGKFSYLGIYTVLDNSGGIEIGDFVHIAGPTTGIWTHTSVFQCLAGDHLDDFSKKVIAPVKIENNIWIGGNTTIYPGVTVGHHSVVLPNSVVNHNISSWSMVGGAPAQFKKQILIDNQGIKFIAEELKD